MEKVPSARVLVMPYSGCPSTEMVMPESGAPSVPRTCPRRTAARCGAKVPGATPIWTGLGPLYRKADAFMSAVATVRSSTEHEVRAIPPAASQVSSVHGSPSSMAGGVPGPHVPAPSQDSAPLHTLLSAHGVPSGAGVWIGPITTSQASMVHGLPSSTMGGVPAAHVPAPSHVSSPLHASPSAHGDPAGAGV
ncbi:hypothetical protein WME91_44800 [Sorangium sp. So ce269]